MLTTKYLTKFQSPRAITQPKIIGLERNVNLICNLSLCTPQSISQSIAKKSGDNSYFRITNMGNTICPGYLPQTCHFPLSTKIQFTLILLLSLILIMIFIKIRHLTRTNFLFFIYMPAVCKLNLEDITSESSIICATESHLDVKILDNYIIIDGFQRSSWS